MREMVLDALEFQGVPFEAVVERLNPPRSPGWTPYIDVSVNTDTVPAGPVTIDGVAEISQLWLDAQWEYETKFALTATLRAVGDRLVGNLSYRGDRYAGDEVARMAHWLGQLLNEYAEHIDAPVHTLDLSGTAVVRPVSEAAALSLVPASGDATLSASVSGGGGVGTLPRQYREFVVGREGVGSGSAGLEFWARRLAGAPVVPGLPVVERVGPHGAVVVPLDGDVLGRLRGVQVGGRVSWFMVVAAAVAAMLHRWTGSSDVTFGCPVGNREGFAGVLGPCLNTVVLRSRCAVGGTVGDVLVGMREMVLDALEFQGVPFEAVVERLNPPRSPGWTPYIDVSLAVLIEPPEPPKVGPAALTPLRVDPAGADYTAKFALTVEICESPDGLTGLIAYRGDRYAHDEVARMARWLGRLLNQYAEQVDVPVHTLDFRGVHAPVLGQPLPAGQPSDEQGTNGRAGQPAEPVATGTPAHDAPARDRSAAGGLEERIAKVWAAVLGVPQVGAEDNFFDLGGTSARLAVLHARLRAEVGLTLPLRALFEYPTVRAMARALGGDGVADDRPADDARDRAALARNARKRRR
jgi:aryl carrier-like protein